MQGAPSGRILGLGHFAIGRARVARAVTTVPLRRSDSPGEAADAPDGAAAAPASRGELEIGEGRALERRAPRSRVAAVSSGSGVALLAHSGAADRPAWAGGLLPLTQS